jgi:catechol 2,3-dioxygenase
LEGKLDKDGFRRVIVTETIAPATRIGEVQIITGDLERLARFYQERLGFQALEQEEGRVALGAGSTRLLTLIEQPGAQPRPQSGVTGLYHFAVLLPDRRSLARLLVHIAQTETSIQGASDHGVSEALYLADPDGNGIELYRDRKREEWPVDDIGRLLMVTDPLDIDDLVMEMRSGITEWKGLPEGTTIGHIHLQVADLVEAEKFYTRVLGFELMQHYGRSAAFVSAGGYHHHIGMNTWTSAGAPPPDENTTGLRWFEVVLPNSEALSAAQARLEEAGTEWEARDGGILVRDPSQNGILLKS